MDDAVKSTMLHEPVNGTGTPDSSRSDMMTKDAQRVLTNSFDLGSHCLASKTSQSQSMGRSLCLPISIESQFMMSSNGFSILCPILCRYANHKGMSNDTVSSTLQS